MSKIALKPADTGSATFTLEAPATNTNRTLTLPDNGGTIVTAEDSAVRLPAGTTAERPTNPADGMIRYNTDEGYIEYYDGIQEMWLPTSDTEVLIQATGGTVTDITEDGVNYRVHTFTSSDTFEVTSAPANAEVEYLVVAGGGSGGASGSAVAGGGGGAGGLIEGYINLNVQSYSINIGAGGTSVTGGSAGIAGSNTTALGLTAIGGGGAGGNSEDPPNNGDGGSGGGGKESDGSGGSALQPTSTDGGFGNDGGDGSESGNYGGGGGGAGSPGSEQFPGDGVSSNITGTSTFYAGGGGGGWENNFVTGGLGGGGTGFGGSESTDGEPGAPNTGSGGGGTGSAQNSGAGGSGIVIIRYPI